MYRHVVIWNLDDRFSPEEKEQHAQEIKTRLEAFAKYLPGVFSFSVTIKGILPPSTGEIILDSTFRTREDLENYKNHPTHIEIGNLVRSVTSNRASMDYEAEI